MNITILCVGHIKEKYFRDAIAEYEKRLQRYCKMKIIEVPDEKTIENGSPAQLRQIREKEGERLMKHIRDTDYCITLEIAGQTMDSIELARQLESLGVQGKSSLVFLIGGSLGLSETVQKRSDLSLSFSAMTFPHQLMRVILLEQIYRSYRIIHKEPYHK
jgi:23S rRNA (pseudouridine1915-N3)-methyltransferase